MSYVPDDFIFSCEFVHCVLLSVIDVSSISVDKESPQTIRIECPMFDVIVHGIEHQFNRKDRFKKGTEAFNELLQLAYMKQVLK